MSNRPRPPWFMPNSVESVIAYLGAERGKPLTREEILTVLRRLIQGRTCDLCGAGPGVLCHVYGGPSVLTRTHPLRLRMTQHQRLMILHLLKEVRTDVPAQRIAGPGE